MPLAWLWLGLVQATWARGDFICMRPGKDRRLQVGRQMGRAKQEKGRPWGALRWLLECSTLAGRMHRHGIGGSLVRAASRGVGDVVSAVVHDEMGRGRDDTEQGRRAVLSSSRHAWWRGGPRRVLVLERGLVQGCGRDRVQVRA